LNDLAARCRRLPRHRSQCGEVTTIRRPWMLFLAYRWRNRTVDAIERQQQWDIRAARRKLSDRLIP
jgi:hypothetical protein